MPHTLTFVKCLALLFSYELKNVCGNNVWIFERINLHCNWVKLINVLNFDRQRAVDYRCVFWTVWDT